MELMIGVALAFAAARWVDQFLPRNQGPGLPQNFFKPALMWTQVFESALWIFGLFQGTVVVGLRLARRDPKRWGVGRVTWAFVLLEKMAVLVFDYPRWLINYYRREDSLPGWGPHGHFLSLQVMVGLSSSFAITLIAVYLVLALGRLADQEPVDGREWVGRAYGALVIAWAAVSRGLYLFL
jgi:hypothetical protein